MKVRSDSAKRRQLVFHHTLDSLLFPSFVFLAFIAYRGVWSVLGRGHGRYKAVRLPNVPFVLINVTEWSSSIFNHYSLAQYFDAGPSLRDFGYPSNVYACSAKDIQQSPVIASYEAY